MLNFSQKMLTSDELYVNRDLFASKLQVKSIKIVSGRFSDYANQAS